MSTILWLAALALSPQEPARPPRTEGEPAPEYKDTGVHHALRLPVNWKRGGRDFPRVVLTYASTTRQENPPPRRGDEEAPAELLRGRVVDAESRGIAGARGRAGRDGPGPRRGPAPDRGPVNYRILICPGIGIG